MSLTGAQQLIDQSFDILGINIDKQRCRKSREKLFADLYPNGTEQIVSPVQMKALRLFYL